MERYSKKAFVVLCTLCLLLPPLAAKGDGMMVPPANYLINERGQKAVIFYEKGVETLVLSTTFQGDARTFAWVVPTPSKPTVKRGSDELFFSLQDLTKTTSASTRHSSGLFAVGGGSIEDNGVTITETKQVDYYDVTVLSAKDRDALMKWFTENKYEFPSSVGYLLDNYVENEWYFTAMRINADSLAAQQLRDGHVTPVMLSFNTDKIVYPLKISSAMSHPSAYSPDDKISVSQSPTWVTGQAGKGVGFGDIGMLNFSADQAFPVSGGTMELYITLNPDWTEETSGTWELANIVDPYGKDIFEVRRVKNATTDQLEVVGHNAITTTTWRTPSQQRLIWDGIKSYHIAVTWSETSEPKLYINGNLQTMELSGSGGWSLPKTVEGAMMYFGQKRSNMGKQAIRGTIYEILLTSTVKSATDIAASYAQLGKTKLFAADTSTKFLAHLEGDLTDSISGQKLTYTEYRPLSVYETYSRSAYTSSVPILLYVLADHKKSLPNFATSWANWVKKEDIQRWALDEQGDPWVKPSQEKYYMTVLSSSVQYADMAEDLFIRQADDNKKIGHGSSDWDLVKSRIGPILLVALICFAAVLLVSALSPIGAMFIVAAVVQFISSNLKTRRVMWILQGVATLLYITLATCVLFLPIFGESTPEIIGVLSLPSAEPGLRYVVGLVIVLLPIIIFLLAMAFVVWRQRTFHRKKIESVPIMKNSDPLTKTSKKNNKEIIN